MVKEREYKGQKHFYCEVCNLIYEDKDWAEKCEGWCKINSNTCNVSITKHSTRKTFSDLNRKKMANEKSIIVTKDGRYHLYEYKNEEELEKMIVGHSSEIFGKNTHYFDIKKKINSKAGFGAVPDGYVLDFENEKLYIIEVELIKHDLRKHIRSQIMDFLQALDNKKTGERLVEMFKKELLLIKKIEEKKLKSIISNRSIIILIDDIGDPMKEINPLLETINFLSKFTEVKVIPFQTFIREGVLSEDHVHSFKAFTKEELEKESKKWTFKWGTVPIERRLEKLDDNLREIFIKLGRKICSIADDIKEEHPKSGYTTYQISKLKNFCAIKFPKGYLEVHIKINKNKFTDPKKITKNIQRTSSWAFDKLFTIKSQNEIDYAVSLIEQAYQCMCESKREK